MKKILFALVLMSSLSFNVKAGDSDPISWGIIYGTIATAGTVIGAGGLMAYDDYTSNTTTDTADTTTTNTDN